jgi:hypothetical protein
MHEGWFENDYLAVCESDEESAGLTRGYGLRDRLPGYKIAGLKGWDDFIVVDDSGQLFTVPTVPLVSEYLAPTTIKLDPAGLRGDPRFKGQIKWYRTPVVFGGSPTDKANMMWITYDVHQEAVRAWNKIYDDLKDKVQK